MEKPEGKRPLERRRHRWEQNIKVDFQKSVERHGLDLPGSGQVLGYFECDDGPLISKICGHFRDYLRYKQQILRYKNVKNNTTIWFDSRRIIISTYKKNLLVRCPSAHSYITTNINTNKLREQLSGNLHTSSYSTVHTDSSANQQ